MSADNPIIVKTFSDIESLDKAIIEAVEAITEGVGSMKRSIHLISGDVFQFFGDRDVQLWRVKNELDNKYVVIEDRKGNTSVHSKYDIENWRGYKYLGRAKNNWAIVRWITRLHWKLVTNSAKADVQSP